MTETDPEDSRLSHSGKPDTALTLNTGGESPRSGGYDSEIPGRILASLEEDAITKLDAVLPRARPASTDLTELMGEGE